MTRPRPFKQVDVFSTGPVTGNPVAVVLDGEGLTDDQMRRLANWTNLSETTFVLSATLPEADYRLRIFTPASELPFAGHPTLGTVHALLEASQVSPRGGRLVQQCAGGLVEIGAPDAWRTEGVSCLLPRSETIAAPAPELVEEILAAVHPLPSAPALVDVGPVWLIARFSSAELVDAFQPDEALLADYSRAHGVTGLTIFAERQSEGADLTVRTFAPAAGIREDPVCGSGNGAIAVYRAAIGEAGPGERWTASQGRSLGRDGLVGVSIDSAGPRISGRCTTIIDGNLNL